MMKDKVFQHIRVSAGITRMPTPAVEYYVDFLWPSKQPGTLVNT
jgi:hypothetical protein